MGKEIERKFLVKERSFLAGLTGTPILQGYCGPNDARVKVRLHESVGTLTLTTQGDGVFSRDYHFQIPHTDALDLLNHHVLDESRREVNGSPLRQGVITAMCVRIRLAGSDGFLTLKGTAPGLTRPEFEYPLDKLDAEHLVKHHASQGTLNKNRYLVPVGTHLFEVDVFEGLLQGLVVAEIELAGEDEMFTVPDWLDVEVSRDRRYANADLAVSQKIPYPPITSSLYRPPCEDSIMTNSYSPSESAGFSACACIGPAGDCPCLRRQRGEKVEITEAFISKDLFALLPEADQLTINALKRKALGLSLQFQRAG